jgi:ABC1 atypical kinase-like domain
VPVTYAMAACMQAVQSVSTADPEQTLINALNTWMGSVMACETFHADVHAGNLLVLRDGRVAFLDFGIVGRMSPATWAAVQTLGGALAAQNYGQMARALATMKATDDEARVRAQSQCVLCSSGLLVGLHFACLAMAMAMRSSMRAVVEQARGHAIASLGMLGLANLPQSGSCYCVEQKRC